MTAVEWLVNEIMTKHDKSFLEFYGSEITQAKEMEKQQIVDAYEDGYNRVAKVIEDAVQRNI
jgi:hypothetical protein